MVANIAEGTISHNKSQKKNRLKEGKKKGVQ
jgi:hypothetical protein